MQAVDYEADEAVTNPAEEAVEELAAAGQEPTASSVAVQAAEKEEKAVKSLLKHLKRFLL